MSVEETKYADGGARHYDDAPPNDVMNSLQVDVAPSRGFFAHHKIAILLSLVSASLAGIEL
jgi:hypothetical protein